MDEQLYALRTGDTEAFFERLASLCCHLLSEGGATVCDAEETTHVTVALARGGEKAGLLAAGFALRSLLSQSPQGMCKLAAFGYDPANVRTVAFKDGKSQSTSAAVPAAAP